MPVGPRGEKRPVSSVSSMVKAMRIATGIDKEEYADGAPRKTKTPSDPSGDEDDEPEYEEAALEMGKPKAKKRKRNKRKRKEE